MIKRKKARFQCMKFKNEHNLSRGTVCNYLNIHKKNSHETKFGRKVMIVKHLGVVWRRFFFFLDDRTTKLVDEVSLLNMLGI